MPAQAATLMIWHVVLVGISCGGALPDAARRGDLRTDEPQRPFPTRVPSGNLMSASWQPIPDMLAGRRVIGMGLPKTGTTSTGWALVRAGLRVGHNQDDTLSDTCQAIINCCAAWSKCPPW